jgi:hypothetical protein
MNFIVCMCITLSRNGTPTVCTAEMVIEQLSQEPSKMQKLSSLIKLKFFIADWFQEMEASVL